MQPIIFFACFVGATIAFLAYDGGIEELVKREVR